MNLSLAVPLFPTDSKWGRTSGGVYVPCESTRMPGESYRRRLRSLLLYLCYVFRALINSLVCWFRSTRNDDPYPQICGCACPFNPKYLKTLTMYVIKCDLNKARNWWWWFFRRSRRVNGRPLSANQSRGQVVLWRAMHALLSLGKRLI